MKKLVRTLALALGLGLGLGSGLAAPVDQSTLENQNDTDIVPGVSGGIRAVTLNSLLHEIIYSTGNLVNANTWQGAQTFQVAPILSLCTGIMFGNGASPLTCAAILPAANGGAGTVNGALKANGAGLVSQAACADLSDDSPACSTAIGTSGAVLPLLSTLNTWSLGQITAATAGYWTASTPIASATANVTRLADRVFMGGASTYNGSYLNSGQTWISGFGGGKYSYLERIATTSSYALYGQLGLFGASKSSENATLPGHTAPYTCIGDLTSGSPIITNVTCADWTKLAVQQAVAGENIPYNASQLVQSWDQGAQTITMTPFGALGTQAGVTINLGGQKCCAMGVSSLVLNDNSTFPQGTWNYYGTSVRLPNTGPTLNVEFDVANAGAVEQLTPYGGQVFQRSTIGAAFQCGGEAAVAGSGYIFNLTGDTTIGNVTVSNVVLADWSGMTAGDVITGTGIATGTTIASFNQGAATVTLSQGAASTQVSTTLTTGLAPCSAAQIIGGNPTPFDKGIVFKSGGITSADLTAIDLPTDYRVRWTINTSNNESGHVRATNTTVANANGLDFSSAGAKFETPAGGTLGQVSWVNNAVNFVSLVPAATGGQIKVTAANSGDANVGINVEGKGTGSVILTAPNVIASKRYVAVAAVPTLSACGTSPTVEAGSTMNGGQFTMGTGTPTACTVTHNVAFPAKSYCTVTPMTNLGATTYYISAQSSTAFTVTLSVGTDSVKFNYSCFGS